MTNLATPSVRIAAGDDDVDIGDVYFTRPKSVIISLINTGRVQAAFTFGSPKELTCKLWCSAAPFASVLAPGQSMSIRITVLVDENTAYKLNTERDRLEEVLVIRVKDGPDCFIALRGHWHKTCICNSLTNLAKARGIRSSFESAGAEQSSSIPKEVYRICHYITSSQRTDLRLFTRRAVAGHINSLQDCLDLDIAWPQNIKEDDMISGLCELLIAILSNLDAPVIDPELLHRLNKDADPLDILDLLPSVNANLVIYLKGFMMTCIKIYSADARLEDRLCEVFGSALTEVNRQITTDKSALSKTSMTSGGGLGFKTMSDRSKYIKRLIA